MSSASRAGAIWREVFVEESKDPARGMGRLPTPAACMRCLQQIRAPLATGRMLEHVRGVAKMAAWRAVVMRAAASARGAMR